MLNEQLAAINDLAHILKSQVRVCVVGQEFARQVRGSIVFYDQVTAAEDQAQLRLRGKQPHHLLGAFSVESVILKKELDEFAFALAQALIPIAGQSLPGQ